MGFVGRVSIRLLMAVVFLIAADLAMLRALYGTDGPQLGIAIVTLPMISMLLLTCPGLRKSNAARLYWAGFEAVGWITVLGVGVVSWRYPFTFFWPVEFVGRNLSETTGGFLLLMSSALVIYTTPQLLAAGLAGRLLARYRVVIERR